MQSTSKQLAVLVSGLAAFFWWAFMFAKHDPQLRRIIPFGEDPYDAVSSFGAIAAVLLAMLALARAFSPWRIERTGQPIYALRSQVAIPFCVLVAVAAEAVAMVRHASNWVRMQGSGRLLLLQAALTGFSLLTLTVIGDATPGHRYLKLRAATIWAGTLLILAVYPEQWILHTPGHLLTVLLGDVLLFAPVSALVEVRFPNTPPAAISRRENGRAAHRYSGFAVAAAIGLAVGVAAYASELSEKKTLPPLAKILFVGGLYVGLGACGLVIAYAFLGRLLGFSINEPPSAGGHFQV